MHINIIFFPFYKNTFINLFNYRLNYFQLKLVKFVLMPIFNLNNAVLTYYRNQVGAICKFE